MHISAHCSPLEIFYFERPPYYYTTKSGASGGATGGASGFLIELTRNIFQDAGVAVVFKTLPPKRIMLEIKKVGGKKGSVGWFKNPDREKFAKFSRPIYQNLPVVILTLDKLRPQFSRYDSLRSVLADSSLTLARISSFSYGQYIDTQIRLHQPKVHEIIADQSLLPKLIVTGRADYMLTAPEETVSLVRSAGFRPDTFISLRMSDIPVGNFRYLIFSKGVDDDTIEKINRSIDKLGSVDGAGG